MQTPAATLYASALAWIESQKQQMVDLVIRWASINSGTDNLEGLKNLFTEVHTQFDSLKGNSHIHDLPPAKKVNHRGDLVQRPLGKALQISKRMDAPLRLLFVGHLDTVYPPNHPFQSVEWIDKKRLRGPGVADMKGGLVVLLYVLKALEASPLCKRIGWEVLLTPDEEIGSPSSRTLLRTAAANHHLGLVFEPALTDGRMVSARKSSCQLTLVARGVSAHAGRDYQAGRNAVVALSELILRASQLTDVATGTVVNVGHMWGGTTCNTVPDRAVAELSIRAPSDGAMAAILQSIDAGRQEVQKQRDLIIESHLLSLRPTKPLDRPTEQLLHAYKGCAEELGFELSWQESGGVTDGNLLAAEGLPTLDSLGVCGGAIHSPEEFVLVDSLVERAKLTALLLMKLANGEVVYECANR